MTTTPTKKLYYGQYDHRLSIKCRSRRDQPKNMPTLEVVEWLVSRSEHEGKIAHTYNWTTQSNTVSVFGRDDLLINQIQSDVGESWILEREVPLDEAHSQMLREDGRLITRKSLLYGKYRVSLRVQPSNVLGNRWVQNYQRIHEMRNWFNQQFGDDEDRARHHIESRGNFHFRDARDAMLMKLVWGGENDIKMERIITIEELEALRTTS